VRAQVVAEDMILQGEAAEDEQDVPAPLGVVRSLKIEDDWDQVLDVLDCGGLAVETSNCRCFRRDGVGILVVQCVVGGRAATEASPEGHGLLLQEVCLRALCVESGGGEADTLLGCGCLLQDVSLRLKFQAALGVGGVQGGGFVFKPLGSGEGLVAKFGGVGGSQGA